MKEDSTREEFNLHHDTNPQPIMYREGLAREIKSKKRVATVLTIVGVILFVVGITAIIWIYCSQNATGPEVSINGPEVGITGADGIDVAGAEGEHASKSGGVQIGGFSISTAALSIIVGGILALIGILKGRKIQLNADGSLIVN